MAGLRAIASVWPRWVGALVAWGLAALTWVHPAWIELVFRVDPDHGSGTLEWAIVALAAIVGLAAAAAGALGSVRAHRRTGVAAAR